MSSNPKSGLLLVHKGEGISSQRAITLIKRNFNLNKIGHGGTLDPAASGLLLCGIEEGTKYLSYATSLPKIYRVTLLLGVETPTLDLEKISLKDAIASIKKGADLVTLEDVRATASKFIGEISQIPPSYSALKFKGHPRYYYARKGIEVEEPPVRLVEIYNIHTVTRLADCLYSFEASCSSGTYIRSLVRDIGYALGFGAVMASLCRVRLGDFTIKDQRLVRVEDNSQDLVNRSLDSCLLPIDSLLGSINSSFYLSAPEINNVSMGREIILNTALPVGSLAKGYCSSDQTFLGILIKVSIDGSWRAKRWLRQA